MTASGDTIETAIGVVLWAVDRVVRGKAPEIDEEHVGQA
jgi:hypothetical protein